jgi:hypothetical protein
MVEPPAVGPVVGDTVAMEGGEYEIDRVDGDN